MTADPDPRRSTVKRSSLPVVALARQSRFQMDDDGDLHEQILHIEAHIEELLKAADARRTELISRMDLKVVADGEIEN